MAKYEIKHEGSRYVETDSYPSLDEAITASQENPKHIDKVLKIYELKSVAGGYKSYYLNGKEVSGYTF